MISTQTPKNPIKRLDVFYVLSEGVVVAGDVESKSRKGLLHYTRIVLDPLTMKITKASCDCEGYTFRHNCWHIKTLEQMIKEDRELRERIEKARQEMMQIEEDIASWGWAMSEVLQTQRNLEELVKLLRIYFQLDEILSFAMEELGGDEIVVEISAVKDRVRKVIERMIS